MANKLEFYCNPPLETFGELREKIMSIGAIEHIEAEAPIRITTTFKGKISRITVGQ